MSNGDLNEVEPEVIREVEEIKNVNKNALATMHNNLIQARHRLSLEEIRLMDTIISFIQPEDEDFKIYKIPVSILKELYPTKRKDIYDVVKRTIEGLLKKPIKIERVDEEGNREFFMANFIADGSYKEGKGYFEVSISARLKPYLLQLKEFFTRIPLRYTYILRSSYSIRLYELLKQYEQTGFRVDYLPDLREMLGIESEEYKRFEAFERIVLKRAIKEINEKTDLEVSYKKKKTGRKITHIEFTIKTKPKASNDKDEKEIFEKVKMLNVGDTPKLTKTPSETLDTQGQKQEKISDAKKEENRRTSVEIWEDIRKLRKEYKPLLEEIKEKTTRLNENQILFLLVNANKQIFPEQFMKEIIINADKNKSLNNPMGFLVNTFQIDMTKAKFKELTLTVSKIDEELFKKKLEEMFVNGNSALKYIKVYWNDRVKGRVQKNVAVLLREPLRKAVYDDLENKVYIPVPDELYRDWFETNFLEDIKEYLNDKFEIEEVEVLSFED